MNFIEKWLVAVEEKNSVLCAGLDPADFRMGRGDEGLSKGVNKFDWGSRYIEAVAPYCVAVKPNIQYWKGEEDSELIRHLNYLAKEHDLIVIDDSKLADIGSTNDAGIFYSKDMGADAVTIAPYAGNMKEASGMAKEREIGAITMCLMSNLEYEREKNMLIEIPHEERDSYHEEDIIETHYSDESTKLSVKRYIQLAHDAQAFGLEGLVMGAPSEKNHITEEEVKRVRSYVDDNMLVLLPGVGKQGGEAQSIWNHFGVDKVIVNVGRSLMFPNGSNSSSEDHGKIAKQYRDMLNDLRFRKAT